MWAKPVKASHPSSSPKKRNNKIPTILEALKDQLRLFYFLRYLLCLYNIWITFIQDNKVKYLHAKFYYRKIGIL